ncbi:Subtilase family protein [Paenibacillus sophorae]|uniref:S8 family serine peptidase n=1 Tax=Paenibacillus sophorae TaxID=1333845 RepID=A0A1H8VKB3_9BACL|nr:S8 family serine peptidase [Paenibacillus sophorae]QWU17206.1 S8 family serine peptidase [Paenibacillus sophorae]SEP15720.1 Subtilase family protein [Paenibacillus sophorae]
MVRHSFQKIVLILVAVILSLFYGEITYTNASHSRTIVIAMLDSGIDPTHPELAKNLIKDLDGNPVGWSMLEDDSSFIDKYGHGTHLAGIIAQLSKENVKILPIRVLDEKGTGSKSDLIKGFHKAIEQKVDIILSSLGTKSYDKELSAVVSEAWKKGILIIAAAGNDGSDQIVYPAGNLYALGVGAVVNDNSLLSKWKSNSVFEVYNRSNSGIHVSVMGPGSKIWSTTPQYSVYLNNHGVESGHAELGGTSQAAAYVAGVASNYWATHPRITNQELYQIIEQNALSSEIGWKKYGYGLVPIELKTLDFLKQPGCIYGQVLNPEEVPMAGISVIVDNKFIKYSNSGGFFRFYVPSGKHTIKIVGGKEKNIEVPSHSDVLLKLTQ